MKQKLSIATLIAKPFDLFNKLLYSDFKLRRQGGRLRVVVQDSRHPSRAGAKAATERGRPIDDAALGMQAELKQLIDQHTGTRQLMRHLAYIERTLRLGGPKALDDVPLDVLAKGYAQLKSIVHDWSTPGLSELRSKLAVTIAAKETEEAAKRPPANGRLSEFFTTTRIQMSEGTASDFQAAEQNWAK